MVILTSWLFILFTVLIAVGLVMIRRYRNEEEELLLWMAIIGMAFGGLASIIYTRPMSPDPEIHFLSVFLMAIPSIGLLAISIGEFFQIILKRSNEEKEVGKDSVH